MQFKLSPDGTTACIAGTNEWHSTEHSQIYLAWLAEGNTPEPADQPAHAQLVEQTIAAARAERQPIISVLDGLQASALTKGDVATAQTIEGVKQQLRDITKIDLSACTTGDEMRLAVLGAYAGIVSANPSLKLAFKEVTA